MPCWRKASRPSSRAKCPTYSTTPNKPGNTSTSFTRTCVASSKARRLCCWIRCKSAPASQCTSRWVGWKGRSSEGSAAGLCGELRWPDGELHRLETLFQTPRLAACAFRHNALAAQKVDRATPLRAALQVGAAREAGDEKFVSATHDRERLRRPVGMQIVGGLDDQRSVAGFERENLVL